MKNPFRRVVEPVIQGLSTEALERLMIVLLMLWATVASVVLLTLFGIVHPSEDVVWFLIGFLATSSISVIQAIWDIAHYGFETIGKNR